MKYDFKIKELPLETESNSSVTDIEGELTLFLDGAEVYFQEPEIKLAELAFYLRKWLDIVTTGRTIDFYYGSIEIEDGPILAFELTGQEQLLYVDSVWGENKHAVPLPAIIEASKDFITRLIQSLRTNFGIDLSEFLS